MMTVVFALFLLFLPRVLVGILLQGGPNTSALVIYSSAYINVNSQIFILLTKTNILFFDGWEDDGHRFSFGHAKSEKPVRYLRPS